MYYDEKIFFVYAQFIPLYNDPREWTNICERFLFQNETTGFILVYSSCLFFEYNFHRQSLFTLNHVLSTHGFMRLLHSWE